MSWQIKGMCRRCGAWSYLVQGQDLVHCGAPLTNIVLRERSQEREAAELQERADAEWELRTQQAQRELRDLILAGVEPHLSTLVRKYRQTHYIDDYGIERDNGWLKELEYFVQNVSGLLRTPPSPGDEEHSEAWESAYFEVLGIVDARVFEDAAREAQGDGGVDEASLDPVAFERRCADILREHGWVARTTRVSGDQGVDVVAERAGVRVVLQCKLYAGAVGNAAVQQALAGMAYEKAAVGCVVSNAVYTTAARQLASTTGILLLHPSDLPRLGELIAPRR